MSYMKCPRGHLYDAAKSDTCPYCREMESYEELRTLPQQVAVSTPQIPDQLLTTPPVSPSSDGDLLKEIQKSVEQIPREVAPIEDQSKTQAYYDALIGVNPVVGWLVCIEGHYRGESFALKTGRNFIGRGAGMDIILGQDTSVSRSKHACIVYDPVTRTFVAQPGDSRQLFYMNGEVVLGNRIMKAYDLLKIGQTVLAFVPFCGDNFTWEIKDKEEM